MTSALSTLLSVAAIAVFFVGWRWASRAWELPCPSVVGWALLPDPHYQSRATVQRLAEAAGFRLQTVEGGLWLFTANFTKP